MTTPEELLCSRKWRMARSLWMLFGWFPFAFAAWIGYLIIGVKSRSWKWIALSIAFFVFGVTAFSVMVWVGNSADVDKGESFPEPYTTYSSIVMWTTLLVWIGNAAVLQWFINRRWLVWRAHNSKMISAPWYATATATGGPAPQADPQRVASVLDTTLASGSGTSVRGATSAPAVYPAPSVQGAPPAQPAPPMASPNWGASPVSPPASAALNINTATQEQLATLPGMDAATAAHVVGVRQQTGRFADASELVTRAGVKPHVFAGLAGQIAAGPAPATPPASSNSSPSSPNGRRLEF